MLAGLLGQRDALGLADILGQRDTLDLLREIPDKQLFLMWSST